MKVRGAPNGVFCALLLASLFLAPLHVARAQFPGLPRSLVDSDTSIVVSAASPRASLQQFMHLGDIGDWEGAARYLNVPREAEGREVELAQKLHFLLQQRATIDLRRLSALAVGDTTDGESGADGIGVIAVRGMEVPLRLERAQGTIPPRWNFAEATVAGIEGLMDDVGAPWLRRFVPQSLVRPGPLNVYLWQWIALVLAVPLLFAASLLVSLILRKPLGKFVARTETKWDDQVLDGIRGPFRLWISALGITPIVNLIEVNVGVASFLHSLGRGLVLIAIFWGLLRIIQLTQKRMELSAIQHGQIEARTLIPLLGNILRITLGVIALLITLAQFGYPVTTLLAGLGIGGIAIALAAQKTVEHLFGSVSLAADRAFRVGDWVRAGNTEGSVERIGLRSTSFRTNERTVIRVPNGKLAEERIETFGERDRMLLHTELDLTYETTPAQLDAICTELRNTLRAHERAWTDTIRVHVVAFEESSIRVRIMAWFRTTKLDDFLDIRHGLYLEFMRIVARNGSDFAFPSRTLYMAKEADADGGALLSPHADGAPAESTTGVSQGATREKAGRPGA